MVILAVVCRTAAWRFAADNADSTSHHFQEDATELTLMFIGKPDMLSIEVLLTDDSGATSFTCTGV